MSAPSRTRKRKQMSVYLPEDLVERLRKVSKRTGVPQARYLRDAVAGTVELEERRLEAAEQLGRAAAAGAGAGATLGGLIR